MELSAHFVENGIEGLNVLREQKFNLILSDIMMPGMDGLTFCQKVFEEGLIVKGETLIIAISANTSKEDVESYLEVGFSDFLAKPLRYETFKAFIENLSIDDDLKESA